MAPSAKFPGATSAGSEPARAFLGRAVREQPSQAQLARIRARVALAQQMRRAAGLAAPAGESHRQPRGCP